METTTIRPISTLSVLLATAGFWLHATPAWTADGDTTPVTATSTATSAKGFAGKWKITMEGQNGRQTERELTLTQAAGGWTGILGRPRRAGGEGQPGATDDNRPGGQDGQPGDAARPAGQGGRRMQDQTLQEITVNGTEISFTTSFTRQDGASMKRSYRGRLQGDVIEGTVEGGQAPRPWRATRSADDAGTAGPAGTWDITVQTTDREYKGVFTLVKSGDAYTGEYEAFGDAGDPSIKAPLKETVLTGDSVKFVIDLPVEGQDPMHVAFSGTLAGDTAKGTATTAFGDAPFTATRRKAPAPGGIEGEWTLTMASTGAGGQGGAGGTGNPPFSPTLVIRKEGTGYAGEIVMGRENARSQPLKEVSFDGKTLKAVSEFTRNGETSRREITATMDGDTLKGEWTSSRGTRAFTGKKKAAVPAPGTESAVGEWEMTIPTPNGDFTSTLIIRRDGEAYAGELKMGQDFTIPLKSVTVEGNTLKYSFEIRPPDGSDPRTIETTLQIDGDTISGEVPGPQGTMKITGKRKAVR